jgi:hypothetical protein
MMREGVCFGIGVGKRKSKIRPKTDNAVKKNCRFLPDLGNFAGGVRTFSGQNRELEKR